jgi:hypothetical protein
LGSVVHFVPSLLLLLLLLLLLQRRKVKHASPSRSSSSAAVAVVGMYVGYRKDRSIRHFYGLLHSTILPPNYEIPFLGCKLFFPNCAPQNTIPGIFRT